MNRNCWLLSGEGILDSDGKSIDTPFGARPVIAGNVHDGKVAVIVDGHEVWTHADGAWDQKTTTETDLNCISWTTEGGLLVGTEKARLAWVGEDGLDFIEGFDAVPERSEWKTPWGGPPDTRSLAIASDGTIYADIHVGWIVRSRDGGETWKNLQEGLNMDVHQVGAHPTDPAMVFAATAGGFHISFDHGETFAQQRDGMPYHYQRACACFPKRDVYLTSTSRGPHGQADARLYRTEDEGKSWEQAEGLPENISKNINTFQITILGPANAFVVVEDHTLYETQDWGRTWEPVRGDYPELFTALVV